MVTIPELRLSSLTTKTLHNYFIDYKKYKYTFKKIIKTFQVKTIFDQNTQTIGTMKRPIDGMHIVHYKL